MPIIFLILLFSLFGLSSKAEVTWGLYTDGETDFPVAALKGKSTENSLMTSANNVGQFQIKGVVYASSGSILLCFQPKPFSPETNSSVNPENNKIKSVVSFKGVFEGENITLLSPLEGGISNINNLQLGSDNRAIFNIQDFLK